MRLVTGEDIIGDVTTDGTGESISKPAIIGVQQGPGGRPQLGLGDFLPFAKTKKIRIGSDKIVYFYEPMPEVFNAYNKTFGNGLVIPNLATQLYPGMA